MGLKPTGGFTPGPRFTDGDIAELAGLSKEKGGYYTDAYRFVKATRYKSSEQLSEKQIDWLFRIREELDVI